MARSPDIGSLGAILKAAVVAGLLAGAITAGMHSLVLEPLIERAIELEEHTSQAHDQPSGEPAVDRPTQRWGMVLGFFVYGATWGMLFGVLAYFGQPLRPSAWTTVRYGFFLALLVGWSVALLPFLKYPANPPGVGSAESIGYRQWLYIGFLGLSIMGTALAIGLSCWSRGSAHMAADGRAHWAWGLGFYIVYAVVVYVAMPANPDPVEMPGELVWPFRAIAFLGLILFWAALGGAFGWLIGEGVPSRLQRQST
jgi:Probable cobalt transporter subunit (CbtA)